MQPTTFVQQLVALSGIQDGDTIRSVIAAVVAIAAVFLTAPQGRRRLAGGPALWLGLAVLPLAAATLFPKEAAAGDETETRTTKQPARLPAHRLAPFERDSTRDSKQAEAAPPAAAEAEPMPAPAPSPSRASRSVVQRVMGWNKRVEKAGAG